MVFRSSAGKPGQRGMPDEKLWVKSMNCRGLILLSYVSQRERSSFGTKRELAANVKTIIMTNEKPAKASRATFFFVISFVSPLLFASLYLLGTLFGDASDGNDRQVDRFLLEPLMAYA